MNQRGSAAGVTIAVIALVISALALILAWTAYNRTGEDLENKINRQVDQSVQQLDRTVDEVEQEVDEGPDNVDEDSTETQTQQNGNTDTQTQPNDTTQ